MLSELAKKNTLELLNDTLTIREFIISSYEKWEIQSRENIEDDIVKQIQTINEEDLVNEGVFLSLNNNEVVTFKEKINNEVNFGLIRQKYQDAVAAKIKISETTVVNAKDFHVYNKQLNDFTHPNKLIPLLVRQTYMKKTVILEFQI